MGDARFAELGPGCVIAGRYRIERLLGQGGMGRVVAATDLSAKRRVALKIPSATTARDLDRFDREAAMLAQLTGPHVPRLHASIIVGGLPILVLEFLDGVDLATWLSVHGVLDPPTAATIAIQACRALVEAHALGLVHRDIKPANLMLTSADELVVKVLDFGISRSQQSQVTTGVQFGSPAYMPPERMRPSMTVDERGDLWAIGVVLFEAVTGRLPFASDVFPDLCLQILLDDPPAVDHPELAAVIRRCLEKQPADRFQSAGELIDALAPIATSCRISVTDLELHAGEPFAPPRSRRSLAYVAGSLALAMAAIVAWPRASALDDHAPTQPYESYAAPSLVERIAQPEPPPVAAEPTPRTVAPIAAPVSAAAPVLVSTPEPSIDPLASPF